jgi:hypothetical protein
MLITPNRGKRIGGFLLALLGLALIAPIVKESVRQRSRTSVAKAQILKSYLIGMGIGPLHHSAYETKYDFVANGVRFEGRQLVDGKPDGIVFVQFDPQKPDNNALALPDSSPRFNAVLGAMFLMVGIGLMWHTWKPIAFFRPTIR